MRIFAILLAGILGYFFIAFVLAPVLINHGVYANEKIVFAIPLLIIAILLAFNSKYILPLLSGVVSFYGVLYIFVLITGDCSQTMCIGLMPPSLLVSLIVIFLVRKKLSSLEDKSPKKTKQSK